MPSYLSYIVFTNNELSMSVIFDCKKSYILYMHIFITLNHLFQMESHFNSVDEEGEGRPH